MVELTTTIVQTRAFTDEEWKKLGETFDLFQLKPLVVVKPHQQFIFERPSFRIYKDAIGHRVTFPHTQTFEGDDEGDHDFMRYVQDVASLAFPGIFGVCDTSLHRVVHIARILAFHRIDKIILPERMAHLITHKLANDDSNDTLLSILGKLVSSALN